MHLYSKTDFMLNIHEYKFDPAAGNFVRREIYKASGNVNML